MLHNNAVSRRTCNGSFDLLKTSTKAKVGNWFICNEVVLSHQQIWGGTKPWLRDTRSLLSLWETIVSYETSRASLVKARTGRSGTQGLPTSFAHGMLQQGLFECWCRNKIIKRQDPIFLSCSNVHKQSRACLLPRFPYSCVAAMCISRACLLPRFKRRARDSTNKYQSNTAHNGDQMALACRIFHNRKLHWCGVIHCTDRSCSRSSNISGHQAYLSSIWRKEAC